MTIKTLIKTLFIGLFIISLASCTKQKLTNTWVVEKYKENGTDKTTEYMSSYDVHELTFNNDNTLQYKILSIFGTGSSATIEGTWEFKDDKKKIQIHLGTGGNTLYDETWECLKLTSSEFHTARNSDTLRQEYYYVKVN